MFGFLKSLFSAPKVVDTAVDLAKGISSGIDAMFFTEEEKEQYRQKAFEKWLELYKVIGSESTLRSMTRRILAIMILGEFLLFLFLASVVYPFFPLWSKFVLNVASNLGHLVLAVGIFYFGPYAIGQYLSKKGDKQ